MHAISLQNPRTRLKDLLIVLGSSLLFGLVASIKIPLPFTPVPIAFTPQLILLFSVLLGRRAVYAALSYILLGAIGLPMFSGGGSGIAYLFGPTGGYIVGYVVAAFVVGTLSEKLENKTPVKIFSLMAVGNALIFVFGLPQLALFVGIENALRFGLYPFLGGEIAKLMGASALLKKFSFYSEAA